MCLLYPNPACRADATGRSNERHVGAQPPFPGHTAVKQGD
jgi:hypothetical protein